jgi:hypothetical protein
MTKYPSWAWITAEELEADMDPQDNLTIKPADEQQFIHEDVCLTAGEVTYGNGSKFPSWVELHRGWVKALNVLQPNGNWRMARNPVTEVWDLPLSQPVVFPLVLQTRLPRSRNGAPLRITIRSDGTGSAD